MGQHSACHVNVLFPIVPQAEFFLELLHLANLSLASTTLPSHYSICLPHGPLKIKYFYTHTNLYINIVTVNVFTVEYIARRNFHESIRIRHHLSIFLLSRLLVN